VSEKHRKNILGLRLPSEVWEGSSLGDGTLKLWDVTLSPGDGVKTAFLVSASAGPDLTACLVCEGKIFHISGNRSDLCFENILEETEFGFSYLPMCEKRESLKR
jgi:hypothetical protein